MSIHVIGDLMLDEWISGDVNRISPEAPVPVVSKSKVVRNIGGSGNLAVNLSNIGNKVKLYSFLGFDENGDSVNELLEEHKNIDTTNVIIDGEVQTTTKTRITDSTGKHIVRVDIDNNINYRYNIWNCLINDIQKNDVICISDYNKGVISEKQTVEAIDYLKDNYSCF
jgi:D-beta-D-heptose 7-phosphate kinase/D-beta-D-heptose 1-phosphate adenosyltransferase